MLLFTFFMLSWFSNHSVVGLEAACGPSSLPFTLQNPVWLKELNLLGDFWSYLPCLLSHTFIYQIICEARNLVFLIPGLNYFEKVKVWIEGIVKAQKHSWLIRVPSYRKPYPKPLANYNPSHSWLLDSSGLKNFQRSFEKRMKMNIWQRLYVAFKIWNV